MTDNPADRLLKDYPNIIVAGIDMNEPNELIPIYSGEFKLVQGENQVEVVGEINFTWFPDSGAHFSGEVKNSSVDLIKLFTGSEKFKLIIEGTEFGDCLITRTSMGEGAIIGGTLIKTAVRGDKSIAVSKIRFSIPNFRDFLGLPVKDNTWIGRNRIKFENDDYLIIIDKRRDFKEARELVASKGGYLTLWNGELTKKKGNIILDDLHNIIHCFSTFLSFLNGRRCSPLFMQGLHDNEVIWTDFSDRFVDPFKSAPSWPQNHSIAGLEELWKKFSTMWKDEDDKDFLVTAIHWYVVANSHSGLSEGSIIMTQTGLELIYNWLIIEKQKLLVGNDAENIAASNKIRLILSHLKVKFDVPDSFIQLKNIPDTIDAPDAFVQIRNAIVHSQEGKRKKLREMHYMAKYDALQLGLWYIELALLKILDFDGVYHNRCIRGVYSSQCDVKVPWTSDNS